MNNKVNSIISALSDENSTSLFCVKIATNNKELFFKPFTVGEVKTIAKILMDTPDSYFELFRDTIGIITAKCTTHIDYAEITELDRWIIIFNILEKNNMLSELKILCPKCEQESITPLDLEDIIQNIIHKVSTLLTDIEYETKSGKIVMIEIKPPTINIMSSFYKGFDAKHVTIDDVFKIFFRKITVTKEDGEVVIIDPIETGTLEFINLFDELPIDIFTDNYGVLIVEQVMESAFKILEEIKVTNPCSECGEIIEQTLDENIFF